ncbi:MAG: hypothetical protein IJ786_03685 [Bacteroidaceae bacterium]|nr:hypothetical protein [Bacteroidaceae bacterium]
MKTKPKFSQTKPKFIEYIGAQKKSLGTSGKMEMPAKQKDAVIASRRKPLRSSFYIAKQTI